MHDMHCPYCEEMAPAFIVRSDEHAHEWECCACGQRWTVKDDDPEHWYAFFPADVHAMLDDESVQETSIFGGHGD